MSRIFILLAGIIMLMVFSCKPSDEKKAAIRLNNAKYLLEKGDTTQALFQLDSISLYPKAVYSANAAKNLAAEINYSLLKRKQVELDSLNASITKLEAPFEKQKTEFDRYVQYVYKKQNLQSGLNRSYIKVHLDERGVIYPSSNYFGKSLLNHYALRIYDGDLSAKTDSVPVGSDENRQSDFMEYKWEKVSYLNGKDNGILQFIADNADRKLKAVFIGRQQQFIILEEYDNQAVKDAIALSNALKRRILLAAEIKALEKKVPMP